MSRWWGDGRPMPPLLVASGLLADFGIALLAASLLLALSGIVWLALVVGCALVPLLDLIAGRRS